MFTPSAPLRDILCLSRLSVVDLRVPKAGARAGAERGGSSIDFVHINPHSQFRFTTYNTAFGIDVCRGYLEVSTCLAHNVAEDVADFSRNPPLALVQGVR